MSAQPSPIHARLEIALEINALKGILEHPDFPRTTSREFRPMPDSNTDAIEAQLDLLVNACRSNPRDLCFRDEPEWVRDHAKSAQLWLTGDELNPPSKEWFELIEVEETKKWQES